MQTAFFAQFMKHFKLPVQLLSLMLVYFIVARYSLYLAFEGTNASPVWPPSGIALGALLLLGKRMWPAITIGAAVANIVAFASNQPLNPAVINVSFWIAIGNTLEALAGFYLLHLLRIADKPLESPQSVFKFVMTAAAMCVVSASIGTSSLILGGIAPVAAKWPIWINWWLGDITGVLIMTPLLLVWCRNGVYRTAFNSRVFIELVVVLGLVTCITWAIFGGLAANKHTDRLLLITFIPIYAWTAYRLSARGVTVMSLLLTGAAIWGTTHGLGPFSVGDLNNSLILLISFVALCCISGQVLSADINQRQQFSHSAITFGELKIAWLTLLAGLSLTIFTWHTVSLDTENTAHNRFHGTMKDVKSRITDRMADYEQILRGGAGLFAASHEVSREEWHQYFAKLQVDKRFPGFISMSFIERINDKNKEAFIQRIRAEGFSNYNIWPVGNRNTYIPVKYIEPDNWRNQRALGYDTLFDPIRQLALERSKNTGDMTISGKVRLAQENGKDEQAGFVMYVPIYRNNMPTRNITERDAALQGYTTSAFRMDDLMHSLLNESTLDVGLEIFDDHAVMYSSSLVKQLNTQNRKRAFIDTVPVKIGEHQWTMRVTSLPSFESLIDRQKAQIILLAGIIVSLLLFILVRSLTMTRESAIALADKMTMAFRESEQSIASALLEKELLLKEVYHRVKNNLQVITSLFNLQSRSLTDDASRVALQEASDRVRAMALVHEKLYQSENLASIGLGEYIQDLCYQLGTAAAIEQRGITFTLEIEPIEIDLQKAVPLGLLLNELISNSLKHGFPQGRSGIIKISLSIASDNRAVLEISDNGVGLPDGYDKKASSLGLKLVYTLSTQINGKFELQSVNGTYAKLVFDLV